MLKKYKNSIINTILFSIVCFLLYYLIVNTNFNEMVYHIKNINITVITFLVLLQCFTQFLLSIQWHRLTYTISNIKSFYKIFYILSSGSVIEALTPGAKIGGEFTRYHFLKKEMKLKSEDATKIIILQKSISMSVLFSISILSSIYVCFVLSVNLALLFKVSLICLSLLLLLFLFSILFLSDKLLYILKNKDNKFYKFVSSYNDSLKQLSRKEWLIQFVISFLVWILFPLKMFILAKSMGLNESFLVLLAITMTAYAIGTLPITPGGIGTFESSMISLFSLININTTISVTLTVVFRIITFWFVFLISLLYSLVYKCIERNK